MIHYTKCTQKCQWKIVNKIKAIFKDFKVKYILKKLYTKSVVFVYSFLYKTGRAK